MPGFAERDLMNDYTTTSRPRSSLKPVLFAVLASFLLGASVVGYLAWRGYFVPGVASPAPAPTEHVAEPPAPYLRLGFAGPRPADFAEGARILGRELAAAAPGR